MVDFEDIHPAGSAVVESPFQETGAELQVERPRDFHEIVANVVSELLTAEDDTRMPREEEQQVEVARVPQTGRFEELHRQGVARVNFLDVAAPFGDGHERQGQKTRSGSQGYCRDSVGARLLTRWYRTCQATRTCSRAIEGLTDPRDRRRARRAGRTHNVAPIRGRRRRRSG